VKIDIARAALVILVWVGIMLVRMAEIPESSSDTLRSQLLLTPRKPSSSWSRPNKERVARLEADGRMAAPGRAMVDLAKASGTWTALDDVENLVEPPELATALNAHPEARNSEGQKLRGPRARSAAGW
jgi:uncharacterized protein YdeI (YjbR/CyaY-like superfamily)